jgi:LIVCS family branched-chain amino acid:cation transporter
MSAPTIALKDAKSEWLTIISTGLALFSMFFGAGNIIFPLIVGKLAGDQTVYAVLGLGISAVVFPFLGLIAMMLYSGHILSFLSRIGKWPALVLLFILQMSQGSVGALPRLVTLMYASMKPYYLSASLFAFSFAICIAVFLLTIRPQKIICFLGGVLTPMLLLTLAALVIVGSIWAPAAMPAVESGSHYFSLGVKMGYQTMDLIAALLFASLVLPHLSEGTSDPKTVRRRMTYASLIASALLMATYVGLCWISAHHSFSFSDCAPEELLHKIAVKILGPIGGIIAASAVFLACLTTMISLTAVFAKYVQIDLLKEKISAKWSLILALAVSALMANLGFSGIVQVWSPLLEVLYPALIVLCLLNIANKLYQVKPIGAPVFFTLGFAVGSFCFG